MALLVPFHLLLFPVLRMSGIEASTQLATRRQYLVGQSWIHQVTKIDQVYQSLLVIMARSLCRCNLPFGGVSMQAEYMWAYQNQLFSAYVCFSMCADLWNITHILVLDQ